MQMNTPFIKNDGLCISWLAGFYPNYLPKDLRREKNIEVEELMNALSGFPPTPAYGTGKGPVENVCYSAIR